MLQELTGYDGEAEFGRLVAVRAAPRRTVAAGPDLRPLARLVHESAAAP